MKRSGLKRLVLSRLAALVIGGSAFGQQTFNTTVYFDWAHFLTDSGPKTSVSAPGYKNDFFAFRRAYFTYENKINDDLKFRFRYDADNTANLTSLDVKTGSTKKDDKLRPFVKHLYLEYANLLPRTVFRAGMTETLTFKPAEERWGYRSVAKTLVDGYKDITGVEIDATSADLGVSLTGSVNKYFRYGVMVSNGSHYSHAESDKWKKLMLQAGLVPVKGLSFVGYMDYEKQAGGKKANTYKVDSFFEMVKNLVLGAEVFVYRNDLYLAGADKYDVSGMSLFGRYAVNPRLSLFGRYDSYEPNSKVDDDGSGLVIAGFDWSPFHSSFKLQPNIWYYSYANSNKKDDAVFNLTFFLSF